MLTSGYCSVRTTLGHCGDKIHILIHKAVAYTFLPNPKNLPEVNHKDGNKTNNNINNLEWCTSRENQQHKYDTGLLDKSKISGENNHSSKLSVEDVQYIRDHYICGSKQFGARALSREFGVAYTTISSILHNETWINI